MRSISMIGAALVAALGAAHAAGQGGDPNLARNLAATCANCHGTNGVSVGEVASLAGRSKDELGRRMQDYKKGTVRDDHAAARQRLHRRADRPRRRLVRGAECEVRRRP